jgi:ABC-type nitrate/sulfonate/bicarbonate transport system substrate-binding protein
MSSTLKPLRIALDWTPNTLHAPLLLAKSLSYYSSAGLDVQFILPSPSYPPEDTPARKLQNGTADLALCPSETVLSYTTSRTPLKLQAISALLRKDTSRIAAIPALSSPAELAGFRYGSYNARFEDDIVRAVVRNATNAQTSLNGMDEEDMDVLFVKDVEKLTMFDALMKGEIEATWVFEPWEGVRARMASFPCRMWEVGRFGVRYGYSPVVVRDLDRSPGDNVLRDFIEATKKGVEFLLKEGNEKRCVEVIKTYCPDEEDTEEFLEESLKSVREYAFDGKMEEGVWEHYVNWLRDEKLVQEKVDWKTLFTNNFH